MILSFGKNYQKWELQEIVWVAHPFFAYARTFERSDMQH